MNLSLIKSIFVTVNRSKGSFAFVYQNNPPDDAVAILKRTISHRSTHEICLTFWVFKTDTRHSLEVFNGIEKIKELTETYSSWTEIFIPLFAAESYEITFNVSRDGLALNGTIALDDFKIVDSSCNGNYFLNTSFIV